MIGSRGWPTLDRSTGIEISNRRNSPSPLLPLPLRQDDTRLLDVTRGNTSRGPRCCSCCCCSFFFFFFFHGLCCDLDGLSTGDLSMAYPFAQTRESCGKSCNSVLRFYDSSSWRKSDVENRGTLIHGVELVFRIGTRFSGT